MKEECLERSNVVLRLAQVAGEVFLRASQLLMYRCFDIGYFLPWRFAFRWLCPSPSNKDYPGRNLSALIKKKRLLLCLCCQTLLQVQLSSGYSGVKSLNIKTQYLEKLCRRSTSKTPQPHVNVIWPLNHITVWRSENCKRSWPSWWLWQHVNVP